MSMNWFQMVLVSSNFWKIQFFCYRPNIISNMSAGQYQVYPTMGKPIPQQRIYHYIKHQSPIVNQDPPLTSLLIVTEPIYKTSITHQLAIMCNHIHCDYSAHEPKGMRKQDAHPTSTSSEHRSAQRRFNKQPPNEPLVSHGATAMVKPCNAALHRWRAAFNSIL